MIIEHRSGEIKYLFSGIKVFLISFTCVSYLSLSEYAVLCEKSEDYKPSDRFFIYNITVTRYFEQRKHWMTSNLGSVLFKNKPLIYKQRNKVFTVLIWKHWNWWKHRHIKTNPLDKCSVKNCKFTGTNSKINTADAVVVHMQKRQFPRVPNRKPSQLWVFLTEESPINTFISGKVNSSNSRKLKLTSLAYLFNWSMTYRSDSDVPIPYGRTVPVPENLVQNMSSLPLTRIIPYWSHKQRKVLVAAMISNCKVPERMKYIKELQKYLRVDLFGRCTRNTEMRASCPGHARDDCRRLNSYFFYLAFENSRCRQYMTEKIFYSSYGKGAIPVVMGAPVSDCEKLLPPHSFLHVNSFNSPRDLAMEILHISRSDEYIQMFHKWRRYFQVVNEHGFFGSKSYQLCRLCEALNYNDNEMKQYDEDSLKLYLESHILCTTRKFVR